MAQMLGSLLPVAEAQVEFLNPGSSLAQTWPLWPFRGKPADGRSLPHSVTLSNKETNLLRKKSPQVILGAAKSESHWVN